MPSGFQLYYITDRSQLVSETLEARIGAAIAAGVDWVQIREKDLPVRRLFTMVESAVECARQLGHARVMVNDRLDVGLAVKAHGVHLGTRSLPVEVVRKLAPPEFFVGASCHSLEESLAAQAAGADYILLGPIFATPSKLPYGAPLGIEKFREAALRVSIPIFALGGITIEHVPACLRNGAAGIAGIRLFQECDSVEALVRELRASATR